MTTNDFIELISNITRIPSDRITVNSNFRDDLGIDSLNMVNLFVGIAEETGISFNKFLIADNLYTIAGAYQFIKKEYSA